MPWKAVGDKIIKADTGEVVGHGRGKTKKQREANAQASVRARYANSPEFGGKSKKKKK